MLFAQWPDHDDHQFGERGAGVTSTNPDEIADALKAWLAVKKEKGILPNLPLEARKGFTHDEQAGKLEDFLTEVLEKTAK